MRYDLTGSSSNWTTDLARACRDAVAGDAILVRNATRKELAQIALDRLGKIDVCVEVAEGAP